MSKNKLQVIEGAKANTPKKGFAQVVQGLGSEFGINYNIGEVKTIKANMKDGEFQLLGGTSIGKTISMQLLKHVPLKSKVLYPSEENTPNPYDWNHLFYVKDGEICGTLIKTYNLGEFGKYQEDLRKAATGENEGLDFTCVETTVIIRKTAEKNKLGGNVIVAEFYFCKDANGKPCRYWDLENNAPNAGAVIQWIDDVQFENTKSLCSKHFGSIYDARVLEEIAENNYPDFSKIPQPKELKLLFVAFQNGYMSEEEAAQNYKAMMEQQKFSMPESFLAIEAAE